MNTAPAGRAVLLATDFSPAVEPAARTARPPPPEAASSRLCLVCAHESEDAICHSCRTRIRGEALEHKREQERGAAP